MTRDIRWALPACLLLGAIACGTETTPRTELVVVVDSDLAAPSEIDRVSVSVRRENGTTMSEESSSVGGGDQRGLPKTVTLLHTGGTLGPLRVIARASKDGDDVVTQAARISFQRGKRLMLRMTLVRACMPSRRACSAAETCIEGACSELDRDDQLTPWEALDGGFLPISDAAIAVPDATVDAAMRDAEGDATDDDGGREDAGEDAGQDSGPACVPDDEVCNGRDDDCDMNVDEGTTFSTVEHCGTCGHACPTNLINARSVCVDGECEIECATQTKDCDGDVTPGCETNLTSPTDCGDCDVACGGSTPLCGQNGGTLQCVGSCGAMLMECSDACVDVETDPFHCGACGDACTAQSNTSVTCSASECVYSCVEGYDACTDGEESDGCETNTRTDPLHCSACGTACDDEANSSPRCVNGTCDIACDNGFTDCDNNIATGCEINTNTDINHCGTCEIMCPARTNATTTCAGGSCGFTCIAGRGNCDNNAANGCETNTQTTKAHCGACAGQGGDVCTALEGCCRGACRLLSLGC